MFKHYASEHFETGVDTQQLQRKMERKVDKGEPGVVGHGKHQWMVDFMWQQCHLSQRK